ncbi:TatD family hydrolase [Thermincola potens]|uniref:Hydrolase, TatD family n=1 Tax=Thermincola potens (strain JR) TaxID=635013 RepID=D5X8Z1_THEPJ|nr:TatD family hydrolase [Thermincola potens]ADG80991.1 hydrolase, TatD family [Thermincola potens JR]
MLIDAHAHLDDSKYEQDRHEMLMRAKERGVTHIVNVGYDLPSSKRSIQLAEEYEFIFAAVGVHPHDVKEAPPDILDRLKDLVIHPKVVAIGEIGLDYYRDLSPRELQQERFRKQIELAIEVGLPIIVHDREAHGDTMAILKEYEGRVAGVLHCFSGSWDMARECINMGYYISFAGPVTFNNANKLREVAAKVPLHRLLVETDAPYLTPEPHRGKRNESAYVYYVAERIAQLRNIPVEELAHAAAENTLRLFSKMNGTV